MKKKHFISFIFNLEKFSFWEIVMYIVMVCVFVWWCETRRGAKRERERAKDEFGPAQMNKQWIWSAAPCVAAHQLNNIKAVLHVKLAHFSHKHLSLANGQQLSGEELSLEGR